MIRTDRRSVLGGLAAAAASAPLMPLGAADRPFTFLVVGDWGRNGAQHQRDVAEAMGRIAAESGARFVLSVGDNFYENGVRSADDPQWRTSFEAIYTAPSLQVPWFVALGNHDYKGNPQAQLDYAAKSARWKMPRRYYQLSGADLGAPELDLFVIDTSPLVHEYREKVDAPIAANVATQDTNAQLAWLDRSLGASTAPIKIVAGHHTLRSEGAGMATRPKSSSACFLCCSATVSPPTSTAMTMTCSISAPMGSTICAAARDPKYGRSAWCRGHCSAHPGQASRMSSWTADGSLPSSAIIPARNYTLLPSHKRRDCRYAATIAGFAGWILALGVARVHGPWFTATRDAEPRRPLVCR